MSLCQLQKSRHFYSDQNFKMKQVNENKIQFYTLNNNRVSIFSYFSISNQAIFRENLAFTTCDQVPNS